MLGTGYLLVYFFLWISLSNCALITEEIPFSNVRQAKIVYSNGDVLLQNPGEISVCGLAKSALYIKKDDGSCNTDDDILPKRGLFNQITLEYKHNFIGSEPYTIVDEKIFEEYGDKDQRILFKTLIKGKIALTTDYDIVRGEIDLTETFTGLEIPMLTLKPNTYIVGKTSDITFCEYETEICTKSVTTSAYPKKVTIAKGVGIGGMIVSREKKLWAKTIIKTDSYLSKYFPEEGINYVRYPVSIDRDDALNIGIHYEPVESNPLPVNGTHVIEKRFAAIGIASWSLGVAVSTRNGMYDGFKASDERDEEQENAIVKINEYANDMGKKLYDTTETVAQVETNQGYIEVAKDYIYNTLTDVTERVERLEDFLLWMISWKNKEPEVIIENRQKVDKFVKKRHPGAEILNVEYSSLSAVAIIKTNKTILSGRYYEEDFMEGGQIAHGIGEFIYWMNGRSWKKVTNPILTIGFCGVIFKVASEAYQGRLTGATSFEQFLNYTQEKDAITHKLNYTFVNKILCSDNPYIMTGSTLPEYNRLRSLYGLSKLVMNSDGTFLVPASTSSNNETKSLINDDYNVNRTIGMEGLRVFVNSIQPPQFSKTSSYASSRRVTGEWDVFKNAIESTGQSFQDVGEAFGKVTVGFWKNMDESRFSRMEGMAIGATTLGIILIISAALQWSFLLSGGPSSKICRRKRSDKQIEKDLAVSADSPDSLNGIQDLKSTRQ